MTTGRVGFWLSVAAVAALLALGVASFWAALAIQGAGYLLGLLAPIFFVLALWVATGRPRVWGGEVDRDEHWWRGGAAAPHR